MFAVPGVLAQSRAGGSDIRLVIRGFGARGAGDRSNAGTSRGIRVLLDGLPLTEPDGRTSFDLVDIAAMQGIEVVRSNASSIWGNAAGGVVNIGTITPYASTGFDAQGIFGSYDLQRYIAKGGTRVGNGSLYGAFVQTDFGGWRDNSTASRPLLSLGYQGDLGERDHLGVTAIGAHNQFEIPGPLTRAQFDSAPQQANPTYLARHERRDNEIARFGAIYGHDFGATGVLSVTAFDSPKHLVRSERNTYRIFDRNQVGGSASYAQQVDFSRERAGRRSSPDSTTRTRPDRRSSGRSRRAAIRGRRCSRTRPKRRTTSAPSSRWRSAPATHFKFLAGIRYDDITYSYTDRITPALDDSRSFTQWTPKLGVAWLVPTRHRLRESRRRH